MNPWLERLRRELDNERQRGLREKVIVNYKNLMAVVDDYERLESLERVAHIVGTDEFINKQLQEVINCLFQIHGRDATQTIIDVLKATLNEVQQWDSSRRHLDHMKAGYE